MRGSAFTPRKEDNWLLAKKSWEYTPEEAASVLQAIYRARNGRRRMRALLRSMYSKAVDPKTGRVYYFHKIQKTVSWTKPLLLGSEGLTPREEDAKLLMKRAAFLTEDEAADMIVGMFRAWRARKFMKIIAATMYTKHIDKESGEPYWVNSKTGFVTWSRPAALGPEVVPISVRTRTPRLAHDMDVDEAAEIIQGMYRHFAARRLMRNIIRGRWKKVETDTGEHYYVDTVTNETTWEAPKLLRGASECHLLVLSRVLVCVACW